MARTGSFGRTPRAMPNLMATLIAIAREQERQRDQNIMEAWQGGGLFEGEPVTDEKMLAHWRQRLEGIAVDDPLYDTYKTAVTQYEYAIAESKMTVEYAHGRISDTQAAQFYLNWAKKVPKDSEFWRVLQRDAGQYLKAAKSRRTGSTKAAIEDKYKADQTTLSNQQAAGQFAMKVISTLAQQGASGQGAYLEETALGGLSSTNEQTNIGETQVSGVDQLMWLASRVNLRPEREGEASSRFASSTGAEEWLFTDDQGTSWTRGAVLAEIQRLDPSFNGTFDTNYIAGALRGQTATIQKQIDLARKTGHISDAQRLEQTKALVVEQAEQAQAWPVMERYADIHREIGRITSDRSLLPAAQDRLMREQLERIGKLADDPTIKNDGNLQSRLRGEANLVVGTVSVWEDMSGTRFGGMTNAMTQGETPTVVADAKAFLDRTAQTVEMVKAGGATLTQGVWRPQSDGTEAFVAEPGGPQWGAISGEEIATLGTGGGKPVTVMIPNGDGRGATPALLVPRPVRAVWDAPELKGKVKLRENTDNIIGYFIEYRANGEDVRLYRTDAENGTSYWSINPNFDPGLKTVSGKGELRVDYSAAILSRMKAADAIPGSATGDRVPVQGARGMYVDGRTMGTDMPNAATGQIDKGVGSSRGVYIIDAREFGYGTEPTTATGYDPTTDSYSPTLAAGKALTEGKQFISSIIGTPAFAAILGWDKMSALGSPGFDETGKMIIPAGLERDARMMDVYTQLDKEFADPTDLRDSHLREDVFRNSRMTTSGTAPKGAIPPAMRGGRLPIDELRESKSDRFAALYSTVLPNSNLLIGPKPKDTGVAINPGSTFTLPKIDPFTIPGMGPGWAGPTATPTSTYKPTALQTQPYSAPAPQRTQTYDQPSFMGRTAPNTRRVL